jgi:hypothetical protein
MKMYSDFPLLKDSVSLDTCVPLPSPYEGTCYRTSLPLELSIRIPTSTIDDKSPCNGFVTNTKYVELSHNIRSNEEHVFLCHGRLGYLTYLHIKEEREE